MLWIKVISQSCTYIATAMSYVSSTETLVTVISYRLLGKVFYKIIFKIKGGRSLLLQLNSVKHQSVPTGVILQE